MQESEVLRHQLRIKSGLTDHYSLGVRRTITILLPIKPPPRDGRDLTLAVNRHIHLGKLRPTAAELPGPQPSCAHLSPLKLIHADER